ncbi:MAG: nitrile hydratase accessory protein [Pseudomonadota bacterium]
MFQPNDGSEPAFDQPWQAEVMALAQTLIKAGHLDAAIWAETLGAALRKAEADGAPDTTETYYTCVLHALETVTEPHITASERQTRRAQLEEAYKSTPHGQPVSLKA